MARILLTNDDGVHSEGIHALADTLAPLGELTIVAPIQEASAIGHALTLRRPLRLERVLLPHNRGPPTSAEDSVKQRLGLRRSRVRRQAIGRRDWVCAEAVARTRLRCK